MFSDVQIEVGFQPKLQFMFRYTTISVKPGFMIVSLSAAPSRRLVAKSRLCGNTHALLQ
jgi:hypothetical protein